MIKCYTFCTESMHFKLIYSSSPWYEVDNTVPGREGMSVGWSRSLEEMRSVALVCMLSYPPSQPEWDPLRLSPVI